MTERPWLWLLAGPNGAGKSTYAEALSSDVEEIVRPDELAYNLSPAAPERAAIKAARFAIDKIEALLRRRRTFAIETTLSGRFHLQVTARAKVAGWNAGIIYIGLRSPNLAISRVQLRHLMGGHDVPAADIRRRYSRSLKNLASVYRTVNRVLILDNSSPRSPMRRVLEAHEGRIVFRSQPLPAWLRKYLSQVLKER
jgi:predicted ABC-type ATPase